MTAVSNCAHHSISLSASPCSLSKGRNSANQWKKLTIVFSLKLSYILVRKILWHGKIPGLPAEACSTKFTGVRVYGRQETFILKLLENACKCPNNTFTNIKLHQIVCLILLIKIEIHNGKNMFHLRDRHRSIL